MIQLGESLDIVIRNSTDITKRNDLDGLKKEINGNVFFGMVEYDTIKSELKDFMRLAFKHRYNNIVRQIFMPQTRTGVCLLKEINEKKFSDFRHFLDTNDEAPSFEAPKITYDFLAGYAAG